MFCMKKAKKEDLLGILTREALAIESQILLRDETNETDSDGCFHFTFTDHPERKIHIQTRFWLRLEEEGIVVDPVITPEHIRNSCWSKREFWIELCGQRYNVFNLYESEESNNG